MSACHRRDGNILLGCADGVKLYNKSNMSVTTVNTNFRNVTSVVQYRNNIYVLHRRDDICKVEMCLPDMKSSYTLFDFKRTSINAATMTVSDKYIVVCNPGEDFQLIIYDIISKEKSYRRPSASGHPYALPDGHLLVVTTSRVAKYKPLDKESTVIRGGLKDVHRTSTDEDGLIYVATFNQQVLYIISPDGKVAYIEITYC